MINNLDQFDVTNANILLRGVNAPLINKNNAFYQVFKIYYYKNIQKVANQTKTDEKIAIHQIDTESQNLAILYSMFTHGHMTGVTLPSKGLEIAISGITNTPLGAENINYK